MGLIIFSLIELVIILGLCLNRHTILDELEDLKLSRTTVCPDCNGSGKLDPDHPNYGRSGIYDQDSECDLCDSTGRVFLNCFTYPKTSFITL